MDRFIVTSVKISKKVGDYLKSNMDRFIDLFNYRPTRNFLYLKSNMDRFIERNPKKAEKNIRI